MTREDKARAVLDALQQIRRPCMRCYGDAVDNYKTMWRVLYVKNGKTMWLCTKCKTTKWPWQDEQ
jgi:hypothetical protein